MINNKILYVSDVESKISKMEGNSKDLVIVTDFDYTLTHRFGDKDEMYVSSFGTVEEFPKFRKSFRDRLLKNVQFYSPTEHDNSLSQEERNKLMEEWIVNALELVVKQGLSRQNIIDMVAEEIKDNLIKLRRGAEDLFKFCLEANVFIYILSAGLGDVIAEFLKKEVPCFRDLQEKNLVKIISNFYTFDENDKINGYLNPVIHTYSKSTVSLIIFYLLLEIKR